MLEIPSPILIFGDPYLSKNTIISIKKKYNNAHWDVISATEQSPDEIRTISCFNQFNNIDKIILIQDIPNRKQIREFLLDLIISTNNSKFILYDSNNHIKIDPKTKEYPKTWIDFVTTIKNTKNSKIIDNGTDFTDKENMDCIKFVQDCFKRGNKVITDRASMIFIDIVGSNRGLILSEARKLCLNSPNTINEDFVIQNAFPTSSSVILYKFGNSIDSGNISQAISSLEEFLYHGMNIYVLADILAKKVRWQLAAVSLWHDGYSWDEVVDILMDMGKFPSIIWHDNKSITEKKRMSSAYSSLDFRINFLNETLGVPLAYFNGGEDENGRAETIPMRFMAQQTVDFIKQNLLFESPVQQIMDGIKYTIFSLLPRHYEHLYDNFLFDYCSGNLHIATCDMTRCAIYKLDKVEKISNVFNNKFRLLVPCLLLDSMVKLFDDKENISFYYDEAKSKVFVSQGNMDVRISVAGQELCNKFPSISVLLSKEYSPFFKINRQILSSRLSTVSIVNKHSALFKLGVDKGEKILVIKTISDLGLSPSVSIAPVSELSGNRDIVLAINHLLDVIKVVEDEDMVFMAPKDSNSLKIVSNIPNFSYYIMTINNSKYGEK